MGGVNARGVASPADVRTPGLGVVPARAAEEDGHAVTMVGADPGDVYALPSRYRSPLGVSQLMAKRLIDVIAAAMALVVLAPIFAVIALLVAGDSGRPILFRWNVVGRRGRPFTGFKCRTMVQDAEALQGGLAQQNEMSGPVFKMRRDPRVTRIGRVLRRYSLDELPQLWSVLKGDMSLVG